MSALGFLSPGAHAAGATGIVELRGEVASFAAGRVLQLTPRRAVALCDDAPALAAEARTQGLRAYDLTAAYAELRVESDELLRRLTEVAADAPTAAPVAGDVPALIFPLGDGAYDLYVPQELGQYVREVLDDLGAGLA
jgi:hypothetical protein